LCPPPDSAQTRPGVAWIDLNDLAEKIGWFKEKPDARKREQLRYKLWRFLVFGEEARVIGQRGGIYHDKQSGKNIETYIESPAWKILDKEMPMQGTLFDELKPAPLEVEIAVSSTFKRIFSDPQFAQFMPLGELLGSIAPNKVAGDWARLMGLALAKIWRCKPRETVVESLQISRRELLTHYTPKTGTIEEILASDKPKRAAIYYREALNILLETGLIAPEGDAAKEVTPDTMLEPYGRKGWGKAWLNDLCGLRPGAKWKQPIEERAKALPPLKPRELTAKKQRRPRPIKSP